ncbi:MAG TPA: preprotein translocase subunit SecE [Candidatus Bathyarchaeia archaeon]|nr:preprotein translocase subunit SecE [Candidatus Bathyarchaeia archaeon]
MAIRKGGLKPLVFLKETQNELKKASWPSREETLRLTVIVIVMSLAVALFIGIADFSFTKLIELIIKK